MGPDTPEAVPGNGQYYFHTRIPAHGTAFDLQIEWPDRNRTDLPGFQYPDNENFATVLPQICFSSRDGSNWERIEGTRAVPRGVRVHLPADDSDREVAIGVPYFPERYERLLEAVRQDDRFRVEVIGKTARGRPLYGISYPADQEGRDPREMIILHGFQHHTEWAGLYLVESIIRGFMDGSVDPGGFAWAMVPCLNIDSLYGGWREDRMYNHQPGEPDGNFNRDWKSFRYPEVKSSRDFLLRAAEGKTVRHGLDIHMGWHAPWKSGSGLSVFRDGELPPERAREEMAFARHLFSKVAIEPFPWSISRVDRPNFAAWLWRQFGCLGQTLEISRFRSDPPGGSPGPVSQKYYQSLGPAVAEALTSFHRTVPQPVTSHQSS
jgi:hypothetical protein